MQSNKDKSVIIASKKGVLYAWRKTDIEQKYKRIENIDKINIDEINCRIIVRSYKNGVMKVLDYHKIEYKEAESEE